MKRSAVISSLVVVAILAVAVRGEAAQPEKMVRLGFLGGQFIEARRAAFRQGLRERGYVEGKNVLIEWRDARGNPDQRRSVAAELARLKVDVIVTAGSTATRVAKEATSTIPIVMAQDPDPIGNGFVVSLARPGGNITGLSSVAADLAGKRLELLKEILPNISRVVLFGTSTFPGNAQALKEMKLRPVRST